MAQTVANLASVLKDAWTSKRVEKQFYNENPILEKIKKVQGTMIGSQAQVPIHKNRSGGYTSTNAAGGSLNAAGNQGTDQAVYTLVYHWFQVAIETAALNQSGGNNQSIIAAKDLEMQGAIDDVAKQCSRQLVGNGDGLIAQCGTTSNSTVVVLTPNSSGGRGAQAIARGHLYPGLPVDIGTTSDSDSVVTGSVITAVDKTATAPTITIGSAVTTSSANYVSIANPNSTTAPNPELNGFRNIAGTGSLGGINPATAGEEFWQAAKVDTTTTTFSIDAALALQLEVFQNTGRYGGQVFTSAKQNAAFYSLLQNQVRYTGEQKLGAGGIGGLVGLEWNGMGINVVPDVYDQDWFLINLDDLVRVHGSITEPTWTSDLAGGSSTALDWSPGTTQFVEGLVWPFQVGAQRRNTHAAMTALTA